MPVMTLQLELAIWDTAGQERFHALGPIYYRDAEAALLVYDITDADSFRRVQTWVQELQQMVSTLGACIICENWHGQTCPCASMGVSA